jgi:hypothetical protein
MDVTDVLLELIGSQSLSFVLLEGDILHLLHFLFELVIKRLLMKAVLLFKLLDGIVHYVLIVFVQYLKFINVGVKVLFSGCN